ncbi:MULTISPECIES: NUDIX hydrolase [unclassified Knoellia]|uniref:NUDIX domain-containing protein n=1 Tax=unclassified Knoellia TaxID=2618719 RepID=UPI0023D9DCC9|nr:MULTISPECIES: NUDIX hydrolase [unclassified Knoellia]MDF2091778.1 NUDIX hydrolase [Knoellia sp. 3-2P3]MDF2145872.1 NUDIX hydrolase [Knoellia sp. p5-6-4]
MPGADEELADRIVHRPIVRSEVVHHGMVWDVLRETVDLGEAGEVTREFVRHPGAVSVVALDDRDRVVLLQQYRHPVRVLEWEVPAGLLDVDGEDPWVAAARELHEEADLQAQEWHVLVDYFSSPGGVDEALRVYLARGLSHVPEDDRHEREGEELGMPARWVDLDEAQDAVLAGRIHNPSAVIGILAAHAARERGWATLRPHDAPWPEHPARR